MAVSVTPLDLHLSKNAYLGGSVTPFDEETIGIIFIFYFARLCKFLPNIIQRQMFLSCPFFFFTEKTMKDNLLYKTQ